MQQVARCIEHLREVGEKAPTNAIKVIDLGRDGIETRQKTAKLSEQNTYMRTKPAKACAAEFCIVRPA